MHIEICPNIYCISVDILLGQILIIFIYLFRFSWVVNKNMPKPTQPNPILNYPIRSFSP